MSLSSIVGRAIELNTLMGVTSQPKAISSALELLKSDAEAIDEACRVAVAKVIHDQCTKSLRKPPGDQRQGTLFELRERYAVDADAKVFKDTERLSQIEFLRIIALRRKQIADDTAHLDRMVEAYRELGPIWEEYPDKLFGEIERIYLGRRRAAE